MEIQVSFEELMYGEDFELLAEPAPRCSFKFPYCYLEIRGHVFHVFSCPKKAKWYKNSDYVSAIYLN